MIHSYTLILDPLAIIQFHEHVLKSVESWFTNMQGFQQALVNLPSNVRLMGYGDFNGDRL